MYYDGSQYKDIFVLYEIFDDKILMSYKLWICCKNYLFESFCSHTLMLVNSTYWVISPSFIPFTDILEQLLE